MRLRIAIAVLYAAIAATAAPQTRGPQPIDFATQIQPIFAERCHSCHGENLQLSEFRIDRKADAFRGGGSGVPAIVPGKSSQSLLIRYVSGEDPDIVMPPAEPRLTADQVALLRAWVDQGAHWPGEPGEVGAESPHPIVEEGRDHWAFQPRSRPEPLALDDPELAGFVRNPIDAFIAAKLAERGWKPNPPAEPRQRLRRVYLDLIGLPPTLAEQEAFLENPTAEELDGVVEDLLSRPAYGERWGRHWLDLVRFAESNGYERDATKPFVWRYRDYVIRAFNNDKPFDRFALEQLAGDELPDLSPETLIATGYNRLGPWDDEPADPLTDRFDQLDDLVSTTGQVFLGLTIGCARCHNHKFEPLTSQDYYSMVAIFDGLQRPRDGRTELALPIGDREQLAALTERNRKVGRIQKQIDDLLSSFWAEFLTSGRSELDPAVVEAFQASPEKRSDGQKNLVKEHSGGLETEIETALPAANAHRIARWKDEICTLLSATPELSRGYFMHEPDPSPPATHLLIRGKAGSPGPEVAAAVPAVLHGSGPEYPLNPMIGATTGRRLALARWITSPENPLTARVIVNRVWQFHFGEGLVRTPSDFGVMGDPPTHPELLDWLANWFVDNGWSFKKLHGLILSSNTYRMSKQWNPEYGAKDPENRLFWRVPYRRLEVEVIRDSMLAVSGRLNRQMYGPSMYPFVPRAALEGHSDPDKIWRPFDEDQTSRRTIYAFVKRSLVVPMIEVLDFCDTTRSTAQRINTAVATQALTLFNGDFVNRQARHFAKRLEAEAGPDAAKQIDLAYRLALARPVTPQERGSLLQFLEKESARVTEEFAREGRPAPPALVREKALTQMCRVILNLNEFVYSD